MITEARWQSGYAAACKAVDAGSIPTLASISFSACVDGCPQASDSRNPPDSFFLVIEGSIRSPIDKVRSRFAAVQSNRKSVLLELATCLSSVTRSIPRPCLECARSNSDQQRTRGGGRTGNKRTLPTVQLNVLARDGCIRTATKSIRVTREFPNARSAVLQVEAERPAPRTTQIDGRIRRSPLRKRRFA